MATSLNSWNWKEGWKSRLTEGSREGSSGLHGAGTDGRSLGGDVAGLNQLKVFFAALLHLAGTKSLKRFWLPLGHMPTSQSRDGQGTLIDIPKSAHRRNQFQEVWTKISSLFLLCLLWHILPLAPCWVGKPDLNIQMLKCESSTHLLVTPVSFLTIFTAI